MIEDGYTQETLLIPAAQYKAVAFIHEHANVMDEKYEGSNVKITFSISNKDFKQLTHLLDTISTDNQVV